MEQGAGEPEPAAHALGEPRDRAVGVVAEADPRQGGGDRLAGPGQMVQGRRELQVLAGGQAPVEAALLARCEADGAPYRWGFAIDVVAVDRGLSAIGDDQRGQDAQQRALPRAVRPHDAVDGSMTHRDAGAAQRVHRRLRAPRQPARDGEVLDEPYRPDGRSAVAGVSHIYAQVVPPLRLQIRTAALLAATRVLLHRRGTTS